MLLPREYFAVDRINYHTRIAYCENDTGILVEIPLRWLPPTVREHDWIVFWEGSYSIDYAKTKERQEQNRSLFQKLVQRGKQQH